MSPLALTNRSVIREDLKTLLDGVLVGTGKPVSVSFKSQPTEDTLVGQTPVFWFQSRDSVRQSRTMDQRKTGEHQFLAQSMVRLNDGDATHNEDWVEDRLDLIEKTMMDTLLEQASIDTKGWQHVAVENLGTGLTIIGGFEYRVELFVITIDKKDD
jgi:hypothetical protein